MRERASPHLLLSVPLAPAHLATPTLGSVWRAGACGGRGAMALCAVVLRDVGAEVPAATVDAAVLWLLRPCLRLSARLDIVPRSNMQCADYIGANASRDVASKFICSGMILPRPGGRLGSFKRSIHKHEYCWPWVRTGPGGHNLRTPPGRDGSRRPPSSFASGKRHTAERKRA